MALRETLSKLKQRREQIKQAQEDLPKVTQRQLRSQDGRTALEGRQFRKKLAQLKKELSTEERATATEEKRFQDFLRTKEGKIAYAQEEGLQGKKIYGKLGKGYANEVLAIEYNTPFGKVVDDSPRLKALAREQEFASRLSPEEAKNYFAPEIKTQLEKLSPEQEKFTIKSIVGDATFKVSRSAGLSEKNIQQNQINEINRAVSSISRPSGFEVQKAPSILSRTKDLFLSNFRDSGNVVSAFLGTGGGVLQTKYDKNVQRGKAQGYQYEGTMNILGNLPTASYFTPAGPVLLAVGGASEFTTYATQPQILDEKALRLSKKTKLPDEVSKGLLVSKSLGEAFLGRFALKQQVRSSQISKLARAEPELFAGLRKSEKGKDVLLVGSRRKAGNLQSDTLSKVDLVRVNTKNIQLERGVGATKVSEAGKPLVQSEFTFFGRATPIKGGRLRTKNIIYPTKDTVLVRTKTLTKGKDPELIKSASLGVGKKKGDVTAVLAGEVSQAGKKQVDSLYFVDQTGKTKTVPLYGSPQAKAPIQSAGFIKRLGKETTPSSTAGGTIKKTLSTKKDTIAGTLGLQQEKNILESLKQPTTALQSSKTAGVFTGKTTKQSKTKQATDKIQLNKQTIEQEVEAKKAQIEFNALGLKEKPKQKTTQQPKQTQETFSQTTTAQLLKTFQGIRNKRQQSNRQIVDSLTQLLQQGGRANKGKSIKPPILFPEIGKAPKQKIKSNEPIIEVFGRRFGKDLSIFKTSSKARAERELSKFLTGSLGRSGYLSVGGSKQRSSLTGLPQFRKSKVDPFRVVQRRSFSLSSGREKGEILQARKGKQKKISFL